MKFDGKFFTIAFAIITAVLVAFVFTISNRQTTLAELIAKQRSTWPKAAEVLEARFKPIDDLAEQQSEPGSSLLNEWKSLRAAYLSSTLYDQQAKHVDRLISLAKEIDPASKPESSALTDAQRTSVEAFLKADKDRSNSQQDLVGKVTSTILVLRYPPPIHDTIRSFLNP